MLPDVLSVKATESLSLEASVTGEPKPEINWLLNDASLDDNDQFVTKLKGDVVQLNVKKADVPNGGNYTVVAKNKLGTARSSCLVTVNSVPTFVKDLQAVEVNAGEDARFDAAVTGTPKPDVSWFFDGKLVENQERIELVEEEDNVSIVLKNCQVEDTGDVKCIASNCAGEVSSETRLNVVKQQVAPKVEEDVQLKIEGEEGEDVLFCLPFSGENIKVRW